MHTWFTKTSFHRCLRSSLVALTWMLVGNSSFSIGPTRKCPTEHSVKASWSASTSMDLNIGLRRIQVIIMGGLESSRKTENHLLLETMGILRRARHRMYEFGE